MLCNKCGLNKLEAEDIEMFICKQCSLIFCSNCIKKEGNHCLNEDCKSDKLELVDSNLSYFVFDQDFRRIKKGGFG
jgi:hypothetical protein